MRFEKLKLKGFGPFKGPVEIDLAAVPGTVVAVTGANGAGKSTLLELMAASLYREAPTRGRLAALANERNAVLEATVVHGEGARHTLRHLVDPVSEKGEALVLDGEGHAVTTSAKLTEFKVWAAAQLPAPELFFSSVFAAQGSGGFLEMKPSDRKAVLLRALGVERLEAMAQQAREHVRSAKNALAAAAARVEETQRRCDLALENAGSVESARGALDASTRALSQAEKDERAVCKEAEAARADVLAAERIVARCEELGIRSEQLKHAVADRDTRIKNNLALLERSAAVRAAAARAVELAGQIEQTDAEWVEVRRRLAEAQRAEVQAEQQLRVAERDLVDVAASQARAQGVLSEASRVRAAMAQKNALEVALATALAAARSAEEALEALQGDSLEGAEGRVCILREALVHLASRQPARPAEYAARALERDDARAARDAALPERVRAARGAVTAARAESNHLEAELLRVSGVAARLGEVEQAERDVAAFGRRRQQLDASVQRLRSLHELTSTHVETFEHSVEVALARLVELRKQRVAIGQDAQRVATLEHAQERLGELEAERAQLANELAQVELAQQALPPAVVRAVPDVEAAAVRTATARAAHTAAVAAWALAQERAQQVELAEADLERAASVRAAADVELAEWTRLAGDLGRDGLQALEIDAAGPELTEMVNDLLHSCVGPRWTVSIETQRASADGKRTLEGCEVRVLDTASGREGAVETFSGGERVLLGEAVSLALSSLACRRSGVQGPTLVRDETGAALDESNSVAYVAMLRRAAQIVGASKILFVSHNPATWELADARLHVAAGTVAVNAW